MSREIPIQEAGDQEFEEMEKAKRKAIVEMLKASIPGFTEWGTDVLSNPDAQAALGKLQSFENKIYLLPESLQNSWMVDVGGGYHDIFFDNPANRRQFRVKYTIVETDAPGQAFTKAEARKKIKGVSVSIEYDVAMFGH